MDNASIFGLISANYSYKHVVREFGYQLETPGKILTVVYNIHVGFNGEMISIPSL